MPDASREVTQDAVEAFAESYLESLGADVNKQNDIWNVELPATHPLTIDEQSITVGAGPRIEDAGANVLLTPESGFFHQLLETALNAKPHGSAIFTTNTVSVPSPEWLYSNDDYETTFYPLYDREAICIWFRASVETVSEYETEYLHVIGIDIQTENIMPALARGLLTYLDSVVTAPEDTTVNAAEFQDYLSATRTEVEDELTPKLEELQDKARSAAMEEFDRYQQLRKQELQEIDERLTSIDSQLADIADTIEEATDQQSRVEALTRREELSDEQTELRADREDIQEEIDANFPTKRREVCGRHAIRASIEPVAVTEITYERGDLEVRDTTGGTVETTLPAAPGIGVLEQPHCSACGQEIAEDNIGRPRDGDLLGACCIDK